MTADVQKASFWKRMSACLFDIIILAIVLEKILKSPILTAATFFAILLIVSGPFAAEKDEYKQQQKDLLDMIHNTFIVIMHNAL